MKLLLFIWILSITYLQALEVNILYLEQKIKKPPVLSNVIDDPKDLGIKGAKLAIKDSNKSAKFLNQKYKLITFSSYDKKELMINYEKFINEGNAFVILNVDNDFMAKLVKNPISKKALLINAGNKSTALRKNYCEPNLLHTMPSNAMLYDGLVQFLVKRDFKEIFLISGENSNDKEILTDMKSSIKKFGAKVVKEKVWSNNADIRRKANSEFPSFTQGGDYDVVILADHYGDFGEYMYFNTWLPRPVAGTQGLTPTAWHKVIEAWGAAQMQKRFEKFAKRWMMEKDFSNWVAVRAIITSLMKTNSGDLKPNLEFMRSKDYDMAAYMGRKISFRDYNGQMRMPIALVQPRALISTSPQVGFLHPITDLDTLGVAPFEMKCKK